MTFSNDPRQVAQSLAGLWPSLVDEPPTPQDYALFLQRQAGGLASPVQATDAAAFSNDPPMHLLAAQVLGDYMAGRDSGAIGPPVWNLQSASNAPAPTIGDDGMPSGEDLGADAVQALPPGQAGALPASVSAVPAAAKAASEGAAPAMQPSSLDRPPDPTGSFYRPEFPNGLDPLPSALEKTGPGPAPPGFFVDPKTGGVSRPRFGPSGDPLNPVKVELARATPQEMQDYFERRVGARANYQPSLMSPEEGFDRALLQPGAAAASPPKDLALALPIPDAQGKAVLDTLSAGENAPSYDTVYGSGHFGMPRIPVSQMTVNQALAYQHQLADAVKAANARPGAKHWIVASPVGKYQFTAGTLRLYLKHGIIKGDTVLTPEIQDRLGYQRLLEAGLDRYRNRQIDERQFQANVANAWRTVEAPGSRNSLDGVPATTKWKQIKDIIGDPGPRIR